MSTEMLSADTLPAGFTTVVDPATHYKVDDGRYWDISQAAFTDSLPEEFKLGSIPDRHGNFSITSLKDALMSSGADLGAELANSPQEAAVYSQRELRLAEFKEIAEPDKWMQLSSAKQVEWVNYYDALMDLPNQEGFPWDGGAGVPWPTKPLSEEEAAASAADTTTSE